MPLEHIQPQLDQEPNLDPEYKTRLAAIGKEIQAVLAHDETLFQFGPTYEVSTSSGQKLRVFTTCFDWTPNNRQPFRKWYLFAFDDKGHVVADRHLTIVHWKFENKEYGKAEGMIATGLKGTGLALPLETAVLDLLQRESNQMGKRITWHISNANLENLNAAKEEYEQSKDPELLKKITAMEQQQVRWQQLYGENGKLGFGTDWNKDFLPSATETGQAEAENIQIADGQTNVIDVKNEQLDGRKLGILKSLAAQLTNAP